MTQEVVRLSIGASYLKRGDTFDPEDFRMTVRLIKARSYLAEVGIASTVEHCERCARHPNNHMMDKGHCWNECRTIWPDWVTDEMFIMAFNAADTLQTLRGIANRTRY